MNNVKEQPAFVVDAQCLEIFKSSMKKTWVEKIGTLKAEKNWSTQELDNEFEEHWKEFTEDPEMQPFVEAVQVAMKTYKNGSRSKK